MSSTLNLASIYSEDNGKGHMHVIDSANLSTGIGLLVIKAAEMAAEGKSADEGVDAVAVFKGLDVADNKRCRFIGGGDWTKPLHVDTEGSNRYRFGSV